MHWYEEKKLKRKNDDQSSHLDASKTDSSVSPGEWVETSWFGDAISVTAFERILTWANRT